MNRTDTLITKTPHVAFYLNRTAFVFAALIFFVGLLLYLPFLSNNYDLNGIIEADAVDEGGKQLFSPNHLLYRPLGKVVHEVLINYSAYHEKSLYVLQFITAISGALGLSLCFLVFIQISQSLKWATLTTFFMGISWSYWRFSTDVAYLTMAVPFIALATFFLLRTQLSQNHTYYNAIFSGFACAGAILVWQANIFLLVAVGLGYVILYKPSERPVFHQFVLLVLTCSVAGLMVSLSYIVIGIVFFDVQTPFDFWAWIFNHPGISLPSWGQFEIERIPSLFITTVASIIPVWAGLGLRDLLQGSITVSKIPGQVSLLAYFILSFTTIVFFTLYLRKTESNLRLLSWLVVAALVYIPFIFWWDPTEPLWFIIVNIFFFGAISLIWSQFRSVKDYYAFGLLVIISGLIGLGNFTQTVWPRHNQPNEELQLAECVAASMKPNDILLATDWNWDGYVFYFYNREIFSLIGKNPGNSDAMLNLIQKKIDQAKQGGSQIILNSLDIYSLEQLEWLEENSGLGEEHFDRLLTSPAFICDNIQFLTVEGVSN